MFNKYVERMIIPTGISYNWYMKLLFFKVILFDHRFELRLRYSALKKFHLCYHHWLLSDEQEHQEHFINAK